MLNEKKYSNVERVISEEPIFYTYPEFIKELENKRVNKRKKVDSILVHGHKNTPQCYARLYFESLYKYKRSNKSVVVIGSTGKGKPIIRKEDLQ